MQYFVESEQKISEARNTKLRQIHKLAHYSHAGRNAVLGAAGDTSATVQISNFCRRLYA